jgi:hypothetical protein
MWVSEAEGVKRERATQRFWRDERDLATIDPVKR